MCPQVGQSCFSQGYQSVLGVWDSVTTVRKMYLDNFETDQEFAGLNQYNLGFSVLVEISVSFNGADFPFECVCQFVVCSFVS